MVHVQCKSAILENSDNLPVWMDYDVLSITNYFQLVDILFTKTAETWARQDRLQPYTYMYNRWYRWYTTHLHVISSQTGTSDDQSESKVLLQLWLFVSRYITLNVNILRACVCLSRENLFLEIIYFWIPKFSSNNNEVSSLKTIEDIKKTIISNHSIQIMIH